MSIDQASIRAIQTFEPIMAKTEKSVLNPLGYIPIVGTISGTIRFVAGKVQAIAGAVLYGIGAAAANERLQDRGLKHLSHGLLNMGRGLIESIPFVSLLTALPYDIGGNRFTYDVEALQVQAA